MIFADVVTDISLCHKTGVSTWAAWIEVDGRDEPYKVARAFKFNPKKISTGELWAVANGCYIAMTFGALSITCYSDCGSTVSKIRGRIKRTVDWETAIAAAMNLGSSYGVVIKAKHVKAHTGKGDRISMANRWCDENSRMLMRQLTQRFKPVRTA